MGYVLQCWRRKRIIVVDPIFYYFKYDNEKKYIYNVCCYFKDLEDWKLSISERRDLDV